MKRNRDKRKRSPRAPYRAQATEAEANALHAMTSANRQLSTIDRQRYWFQVSTYQGNQKTIRALGNAIQRQNGDDTSFNIQYDLQRVPQMTNMSCWAAGAAMLVGWRDSVSINPDEIANRLGYWSQYNTEGLDAEDTTMFSQWGLTPEPPQTYTVLGFKELLESYGPLWVAEDAGSPHIVVVTGMSGDGSPHGSHVHIHDPWPVEKGATYLLPYSKFVSSQERLAEKELMSDEKPIYVAHC